MSVYTYDKDTVSFHRTLYSYGRRQQMRSIIHACIMLMLASKAAVDAFDVAIFAEAD